MCIHALSCDKQCLLSHTHTYSVGEERIYAYPEKEWFANVFVCEVSLSIVIITCNSKRWLVL